MTSYGTKKTKIVLRQTKRIINHDLEVRAAAEILYLLSRSIERVKKSNFKFNNLCPMQKKGLPFHNIT